MNGRILLSSMFSCMIMIGGMVFAADMNLRQKNPSLKCIRESGSPVTAMVMYYDDEYAVCGDEDGNIILITPDNGYEKLKSTGLGRIDSIVLGNIPGGVACFTVQGGCIYEYSKGKTKNISGAWNEKVKDLRKRKNSKTIYAVTENGNLYIMSDKGDWKKASVETAKKVMKRNAVEIDRDTFVSKPGITSLSSRGKVKFAYSGDGKIYAENQCEADSMRVDVSYVSDAVNYPDAALYRVEIEGRRLITDDIFKKGYNGFKYTLSCNNDTQYNKDAYPILGAIYTSDGRNNATLRNRKISFLWLGPKLKENEELKLTVEELACDFSNNVKLTPIDHLDVTLPEPNETPDYSDYEVKVFPCDGGPQVHTYPNGVCGTPFNVIIYKNNEAVDAGDPVYDNIVFYASASYSGELNEKGLIGCDPSDATGEVSSHIAIIPDSCVEIANQYIKYGSIRGLGQDPEGRRFYVYSMHKGQAGVIAGLVCDMKFDFPAMANFSVYEESYPDIKINADENMNNPDGRIFSFSQNTRGSNWKGNKDYFEIGAGYLDYQLGKYEGKEGVFVYFPEGYNTRDFKARKDLRDTSLTVGYYCDPSTDVNDPLLARYYKITDTTSYCEKMRDRFLYAVLFDQLGRCAVKNDKDPDGAMSTDGKYNLWDLREKGNHKSKLHTEIIVSNTYAVPIVVNSKLDSFPEFANKESRKPVKYGITETGVFLPPYSNEVKFMTEKAENLYENRKYANYFGVSGRLFNNDEERMLFANYFEVWFDSSYIRLLYAQLNKKGLPEGDKTWWQTPEKDFDPNVVQSYITTNMEESSLLKDLYITYGQKEIAKEINSHHLTSNSNKYTGPLSAVGGIGYLDVDGEWSKNRLVRQSFPQK